MATDADGDIYCIGYYANQACFGGDTIISSSGLNTFIVKIDPNGMIIWTKSLGGSDFDAVGYHIDVNSDKQIMLTGYFESGNFILGQDTLHSTAVSTPDIFTAKMEGSPSSNCDANFMVYPVPNNPHHYYYTDLSSGEQPIWHYWTWGDGFSDTGPSPSHVYISGGLYQICLTIVDALNCTSTYCESFDLQKSSKAPVYIEVTPSGMGENSGESPINVFPNPANDQLNVVGAKETLMEILDLQGQIVRKINISDDQTSIGISDLAKGMYFIKLTTKKETETRKLIID